MKLKLLMSTLLLMFMVTSVQAAVTLTSCGTPGGGWVAGETYILDFANPIDTSNYAVDNRNACFDIYDEGVDDITFTSNNLITLGNMHLVYVNPLTSFNINFENMSIIHDTSQIERGMLYMDSIYSTTGNKFNNNREYTFTNLNYTNVQGTSYMVMWRTAYNTGASTSVCNLGSSNNRIDVTAENTVILKDVIARSDDGALFGLHNWGQTGGSNRHSIAYARFHPTFNDTQLYSDQLYENLFRTSSLCVSNPLSRNYGYLYPVTEDSLIIADEVFHNGLFASSNLFPQIMSRSLVQGYSNPYNQTTLFLGGTVISNGLYNTYFQDPAVILNVDDAYYTQDAEVSNEAIIEYNINNPGADLVFTEDKPVFHTSAFTFVEGSPNVNAPYFIGTDNNAFLETTTLDNKFAMVLNQGLDLDCSLDDPSTRCIFNDNGSVIDSNLYKGMIGLYGDQTIKNVFFDKDNSNNLNFISNFNLMIISNPNDILIENLDFTNNFFNRDDSIAADGTNYMISLAGNNINIEDNIFNTDSTTNQELLNIYGTSTSSNNVHGNSFEVSIGNTGTHEIFTNDAYVQFYNNNIEQEYVISNGNPNGLDVNPLIPYVDGNMVYYFRIGNYYEANSACVDGNGDDICDNPYVSGNVTDFFPLVNPNYDFAGNLLFAQNVSTLSNYSVTLSNPQNGGTVVIPTQGETLSFSFTHDGSLNGINCNLVLDGTGVSTIAAPFPGDTYSLTYSTTWAERLYNYTVECSEQVLGTVLSPLDTFVIQIGGSTGGNNTNGGGNNTNGGGTSTINPNNDFQTDESFEIFTDDITTSADNAVGLFKDFGNGFINMMVPIVAFILILFGVLIIFALLR